MNIAVISGASSGMGREFVLQLDKTGLDEIWVIARHADKLEELKPLVPCPVRVLALDLSKEESIDAYRALLEEEKPRVRILVNASGFGKFGTFTDMSLEDLSGMVDLNSRSLMAMTYVTLPYMSQGDCIYQLGSLSSFQPVPYIAVYGATKAFVVSFSRAIGKELRGRGIRVMAVCPGWVKTAFFDRAVYDDTITYYNRYFTPEEVVARAIRDMKKGKEISICGWTVRNQVRLTKLLPHSLVMKIWCKQQKK